MTDMANSPTFSPTKVALKTGCLWLISACLASAFAQTAAQEVSPLLQNNATAQKAPTPPVSTAWQQLNPKQKQALAPLGAQWGALTGQQPRHYFGDSHNPNKAQVRDLKEETLRVFRSRVVNPKWLDSIRKHGYKGGLELTATVDYLFGYDATAKVMEDWMYEQVANEYAFDPVMQEFLQESNPWAQNAIAERLLEAAERGMWSAPKAESLESLRDLFLSSETMLEARGETSRSV